MTYLFRVAGKCDENYRLISDSEEISIKGPGRPTIVDHDYIFDHDGKLIARRNSDGYWFHDGFYWRRFSIEW